MQFTSLDDWLRWQETLHPSEIDLGLERISRVFQILHPDPDLPKVITVAGTNGKGSSCAMLESIYRAAGYQTGLYTSPHLFRYNERIRLNGEAVSNETICGAFERIDNARSDISLTYFEFGTLAALDIFLRYELDVIILEVGLGGRLDAVNIIEPDVALITSISRDHTQWLGNDIDGIAREKAGIMRHDKPVVFSSPQMPGAIEDCANKTGAILYRVERDYQVSFPDDSRQGSWNWQSHNPESQRTSLPRPALHGDYQVTNAAGVLMVIALLSATLPVSQMAVRDGLSRVQLPGRFQVMPGEVMKIFDVAHNEDAIKQLAGQLSTQPCHGRTLAVLGMLADKEIEASLSQIQPIIDKWFVGGLDSPRSASAEVLQQSLESLDNKVSVRAYAGITQAYQQAQQAALPGDRIVVFGSFYTVAEILPLAL